MQPGCPSFFFPFWGRWGCWIFWCFQWVPWSSQCVPQHVFNSYSLYLTSFALSSTLIALITSPKEEITTYPGLWSVSSLNNLKNHKMKISRMFRWRWRNLWTQQSYVTLRLVSSLNNPQNSEMKFCENMKLTCWKSS
jgi:hypothetical protein